MAESPAPENEIESAIAAIGNSETDDPDGSKRRAVLAQLAMNPVIVLLREPWEGADVPDQNAELMYVSDGDNTDQPMLALFTSAERALQFDREHGGFKNPCTVPGPWAIGNVADKAGVMVNPNQSLAFRIIPELVTVLQDDITTAIKRARERAGSEGQSAT